MFRTVIALVGCMTVAASLASSAALAQTGRLRIYILAGQSNMEGHAKIETFDYIGDDPKTAPLLKQMRAPDGKPTVCDGVWISYFTGGGENNGEGFGKLTAGYGSRRQPDQDGGKIGPELNGTGVVLSCCGVTISVGIAWARHELVGFRPALEFSFFLSAWSVAYFYF